jgi:hypothetical protein
MKFILVNGRRPRSQTHCEHQLCCMPIGENYLREIATQFTFCDRLCYVNHCKVTVKARQNYAKAS